MTTPVNIPALVASVSPTVQIENGQAVTTSAEVARVFDRRHDDVLKAIRNLLSDVPDGYLRNFAETEITRSSPLNLCYSPLVPKGMGRRNPEVERYPHPSARGFFAPAPIMAGGVADTRPARGRSPLGSVRVSNPLAALRATRRNVPARFLQASPRSVA